MSELKKQDIESLKEFCGHSHLPILKELAIIAFDELLRLRTDAGDEEVERLGSNAVKLVGEMVRSRYEGSNEREVLKDELRTRNATKLLEVADKLRDIAIARGNELREAREEIEQLRMAVGCATTIKGDMVMRADDPLGMMQEVCSYVATLRSCPEMGEVDALIGEMDAMRDTHSSHWMCDEAKKLTDIARRAIASHAQEKQRADELIRLMTRLANAYNKHGQLYDWAEEDEDAAKILAICGKGDGA